MALWPADRPSIVSYAFLRDSWDQSEAAVATSDLTRTVVLVLSDRSSCRLLMIPPSADSAVVEQMLDEASDPHSAWTRMDFASTSRPTIAR